VIDVVRKDGHLVVHADLPGIKPDELKIEVEDDILTLSGEHTESKEEKDKTKCGASAATVLLALDDAARGDQCQARSRQSA
jgi:HSP20 family protein